MSDKYTIQSDDFRSACVACLLLGEGHYALKQIDGDEKMPLFLLGGHEAWIKEHFDCTVEQLMESVPLDAIADVLDTIVIGNRADFEQCMAAITTASKRLAFIADWNDRKRSSMNDIGGRARALAKAYRKAAKKREGVAS